MKTRTTISTLNRSIAVFVVYAMMTFIGATAQESAQHREMMMDINGTKIHVEVDGNDDAPGLLLWNGYMCTTKMWDDTIPELKKHFRVVRFDVRGTGQSDASASPDDYTMEQLMNDGVAILDNLGIDKAYVWTMAWGSRCGVAFGAYHPERIKALALYDVSVAAADVDAQMRMRKEAIAAQEAEGIPKRARPEGAIEHRDPEEAKRGYGSIRTEKNLSGLVDRITVPTLVCTGDYDPNLVSSRDVAARIPNAELVVMKNVGHGSVMQRPDLAVEKFLDFVRRNGGLK
jgi:3-oxoadipate enol-lactonase